MSLGADLPGAFSSLGPGPGQAFGEMFSPLGCRRSFPRESGRWAPHDCPPLPPWDNGGDDRGPEDCFREGWHSPCPWDSRPFPGPADFRGNEKDRRWAPRDCPPLPPWDDREDNRGPEDCFREGWHPPGLWDPRPFPGPADFRGNEDRRWAPRDCPPLPPWDDREDNRGPEDCFREGWHPELPPSGPGCFAWPEFPGEEQQPPSPPARPPEGSEAASRMAARPGATVAWGPPAVSGKVPESPRRAGAPQKSPAADPQAPTEAAEPEQAAGATPVEPGARQEPAGSHGQGPSASETEPAPPEESSAETGEHLEVEPCSQSVPKAGAGGGSHPHSPTAPPEPAERVHAAAGSAGEVGAELCPRSRGRQRLPSGAGEAEPVAPSRGAQGSGTGHGLLGGLQPSENSQVPPGATAKPDAQPSQAGSDVCAAPAISPGTRHPPGSGETEPSYQQFSLTIAVVATMLLQKEPSMEAALGLALRANLRQGRIHHLQELEDFINSYDSATLSR
ncbi:PREDICTED: proline-rich protein 2-like [Aptenodytes forsteri]|uniref:proline-rich protein 2-like n=1 Tax=Aptenodytes forsteri TaxID=9233 RepID=UPI0009052C83|nr:PREDICTED: proline-rich protein 2-like [Aptenodytes forsteri]